MKPQLPPGPKSRYPLAHLPGFRRDILGFMECLAKDYGDASYFKVGPIKIILLNHPDYIKEVLTVQNNKFVKGRPLEMAKSLIGEGILTSEGEYHKQHAKMIQPAFHRKKIESYVPAIIDSINGLMGKWDEGMQVDMKNEMTKLATIISGKTMFNENVEEDSQEIIDALDMATGLFGRIQIPFSEYFLKLPFLSNNRFWKAKKRLDQLVYGMIDKRRKSINDHDDLLSMLMFPYEDQKEASGLTDLEIRDEALTLFLTAFDTTSTALTWTWYLLSQHPEVEAEFHRELDNQLNGKMPNVTDIENLRFTRKVLTESMRLFPPTYVIPRQATEDVTIANYLIPKGSIVLMSPYLIHRDPRYYSDPLTFNPHIWDEQEKSKLRFQYFPFSGGPRMCIGEPFAWMEGILALATIGQFWKCKMVPGHPVEMLPLINLRPKYGIQMTVHSR